METYADKACYDGDIVIFDRHMRKDEKFVCKM